MDRALDSLSSDFRPLVFEVLARLVERGVAVMVVQTSRTMAEHQVNLANGSSAVVKSKHLPRKLRGWPATDPDAEKADAIDLVPYLQFELHGADKVQWDDSDPAWLVIRDVGEAIGLRSGARWTTPHDPGHLEFVFHPSTMPQPLSA